MECLQIDWKNLDNAFERDEFYESIQAPKWIDFTAPEIRVDDHEWFCGKIGCKHEKKSLCQASGPIMDIAKSISPPKASVEPLVERTINAVSGKRGRGIVSSSLSSLPTLKKGEPFPKSKVLNMPAISECKGEPLKKSIHRASENENPNRSFQAQGGVSKGFIDKKKTKLPEQEKSVSDMKAIPSGGVIPIPSEVSTALEQQNLADGVLANAGKPLMAAVKRDAIAGQGPNASKPLMAAGKRDVIPGKGVMGKIDGKDELMDANKIEGKDAHFVAQSSRLALKPSHLKRSMAVPVKKVIVSRSLQNACFNSEKSNTCRLPPLPQQRTVQACSKQGTLKENKEASDSKEAKLLKGGISETGIEYNHSGPVPTTMLNHDVASPLSKKHSKLDCDVGATVQEASHPKEGLCAEDNNLNGKEAANETCSQLSSEEGKQSPKKGKDDSIESTLETFLRNLHLMTPDDEDASNRDKQKAGQYLDSPNATSLQVSKSQTGTEASSQGSSCTAACVETAGEKEATVSKSKFPRTAMQHRQVLQSPKFRLAKKRKSSDLNFSSKNHRHKSLKMPAMSTTNSHNSAAAAAAPIQTVLRSSKEKKTKFSIVKPFRLRTEERSALKELGLKKKEDCLPNSQELVHHHQALRMPSFGHPFRPRRSTKQLTIPKEPKFHLSKTIRKTCTKHVTVLAS